MKNPIKVLTAKVISEQNDLYGEYAVVYEELKQSTTLNCIIYLIEEFIYMF